MDGLKSIVNLIGYDRLETALIELCITVANELELNGEVLCDGTIRIQGPHVSITCFGCRVNISLKIVAFFEMHSHECFAQCH